MVVTTVVVTVAVARGIRCMKAPNAGAANRLELGAALGARRRRRGTAWMERTPSRSIRWVWSCLLYTSLSGL
ncbi:hypothetical protein C455_06970, partial [Haloferax larsenii JCM 13917]